MCKEVEMLPQIKVVPLLKNFGKAYTVKRHYIIFKLLNKNVEFENSFEVINMIPTFQIPFQLH